jgi:uncharacterized membrane protein
VTVKTLERSTRSAGRARHAGAPAPARRRIGAYVAALALIAVLVPLHGSWAAQVLLIPLLLTVPGVILLRALRVPGLVVAFFPVYVPCASIAVLFGSGLAVDLVGPLAGVAAPLRAAPLLISLEVISLALLAVSIDAPSNVAIPWRSLSRPARLAWPLILPLTAVAGALRLNSGHGDGIALIALCAGVVLLITTIVYSMRLDNMLLAIIIYAAELALMWSFSLRGSLVYGFDIATEYYKLHQTVLTGIWHTGHSGDAYGAMLSVTVMPAELHFLSGLPALLVLKVVYPAISALFPVAIFGLARRILSRRWAFAAAAFFVMQGAFAQELPAIARQEIAIVLFGALLAAMLDTRIPWRSQWALVALLGLTMALSHYSTTYVAVTLIGLMILLQWLSSWFRDIPHVTGAIVLAFITSLAGAVIWYGPVTHSTATGLSRLAQTVETRGLNVLPNKTHKESLLGVGLLAAYLRGNTQTPISAEQYARLIHAYYVSYEQHIAPGRDANLPRYALRNSDPPAPPGKWGAGYSALSLGSLIIQQLINLLGAIGALLIVLRRKTSIITRQVGLLALGTVFFLALIRLSGTLAAAYNQERALLQSTAVIAITLCWSMQRLAGWRKRRQAAILALAAVSLAVLFITTSGLVGAVLGGGGTQTNLANSGADFESFYMTTPELASARWLGMEVEPGQLVYADRYAQLPLTAMTGISSELVSDVTPLTLNQYAWVYASRSNIIDRRARALFDGHAITYAFPAGFLDTNYDVVYTDGSSEVFHW